MENANVTLGVQ